MTDEIDHRFTIEEMVPAPAQAALAVEALEGSRAAGLMADIDDPVVRKTVEAERALLAHTRAGCRSALGALGTVGGEGILLIGFVEDESGPRHAQALGHDPDEVARLLQSELGL